MADTAPPLPSLNSQVSSRTPDPFSRISPPEGDGDDDDAYHMPALAQHFHNHVLGLNNEREGIMDVDDIISVHGMKVKVKKKKKNLNRILTTEL